MKAYEKFEAKLRSHGLYDQWVKQGRFGRVGTETEHGIIILVHEDKDDKYTIFFCPTMSELEKNDEFRQRALDEFAISAYDDYEFIGKLYAWKNDYQSHDCPLNPVDVYFLVDNHLQTDFEDDAEETIEDVLKHYEKTDEWCPHCDEEVELEHDLRVQKCPCCGKWIVPCSICPLTDCTNRCPLERLAIILNDEDKK